MKLFNIFLLLIFFSNSLLAQEEMLKFSRLSLEEGLSHDNVYTIIQDKEGFMWVGTQNGLDRYDGYNFMSFYHDAQDSCSLISANFGVVKQDSKSRIWIGTYRGGLHLYDPINKRSKYFTNDANKNNSIASNLIRGIVETKDSTIWIASTLGGLSRYNEKTKDFTQFLNNPNNPNSISNKDARAICEDTKGNIWIGTSNGLNKLNPKTNKFTRYFGNKNQPGSLSSSTIQSLFVDRNGNLWIGTRGDGLNVYDPKTETFKSYYNIPGNPTSINDNRIQCIFQDSNGTIWIGTYEGGLSIFDPKTETFKAYLNDPDDVESISGNTIESITEDQSHNLWIATRGGGISILDLKPSKFLNFSYNSKKISILPQNNVTSIAIQGSEIIWFGTDNGLSRYNLQTKQVRFFQNNKSSFNSISSNRIRTLLISKDNTVWVGTYTGGLNKIENPLSENPSIVIYKPLQNNNNSICANQINTLFEDKYGAIWIGTVTGLDKLTYDNNKNPIFEHFKSDEKNTRSLCAKYITFVFQDSKDKIWVGTSSGLNLYEPASNTFEQIFNKSASVTDLDVNALNCMFEDSKGELWIGTDGGGLYNFKPETKEFHILADENFKSGNISGIAEDSIGNLWISTGKGIRKFDLKKKKFTNYSISDGLSETGFNRNSICKHPNGELYFGSISGFAKVKPENIVLNQTKPHIVLTELKIFNDSYFKNQNSFCSQKASELTEIELSYKDYVISFEFAALDFTNPAKNKYAYKMDGFNDDWIEFGTKRYATFTSLPPGEYIFRVKGTNNDGIWSDTERGLAIKVIVKPPYWQTTIFYIIIGIIIVTAVTIFFRLRLRKLNKEKEVLETRVKQRTQEVENQNKEIKQQAVELKKSNQELEKLSIVASGTDNAVTIMDSLGNFEWVNPGFTRMYGYTFDEFVKILGTNVLSGVFSDEIKASAQKSLSEKKTIVANATINNMTGKSMWLQTTWTPILNKDNQVVKLISIDSDITEIKSAQDEITIQKDILQQKNIEINHQNEQIKSSILYAKTIQNAILPSQKKIDKLGENFILYLPKDIVSGDFYWFSECENYQFLATIDCTGHGVPGAFMSMIANSLLNEIVNEKKVYLPRKILTILDKNIANVLNQKESGNRDGMDVCLIRIEKIDNNSSKILFAGAKRDLYYYKESESKIIRLKGSRKSVGGIFTSRSKAVFGNQEIIINSKDILYLSTDGYIDQNDKNRMRFGTQRFMLILQEIAALPLEDQKDLLLQLLHRFQQSQKQRDDITIVGLKLNNL